jgi:peroxiredoxin
VSVVAISADPAEDSRGLAAKLGLTFPLLVDDRLSAATAWGVLDAPNEIAWPALFLVDGQGAVAWRSLSQTYKERPPVAELLGAVDALPRGDARTR